MAEIESEMPSWTKDCLEFNESKDFVLDHRLKYNTKMAELEREIATTRVIYFLCDFVTFIQNDPLLSSELKIKKEIKTEKLDLTTDFVTVFKLAYCCHKSHFLAETDHNPLFQNSYFNYLDPKAHPNVKKKWKNI